MSVVRNHGLYVHSTHMYKPLPRGGKQVLTSATTPTGTYVTVNYKVHVPYCLNPINWKRFGLSREDIKILYEDCPSFTIWQTVLAFMLDSQSVEKHFLGCKPTRQNLRHFTFIFRRPIFDMFLEKYKEYISPGSLHLCITQTDHKPHLPIIHVSQDVYDQLKKTMCPYEPGYANIIHCTSETPFTYQNGMYLPMEYGTEGKIYLRRIYPFEVYDAMPRMKPSIITSPSIVTIHTKKYVLVDEACFACVQ